MQGYRSAIHLATLCCLTLPAPVTAQDALLEGTRAMEVYDYGVARRYLEEVLLANPASYEANWRLASVLLDVGKASPEDRRDPVRDSLYREAESYARRAIAAKPDGADGHFVLAAAIGRASLTLGKKERIERATEIRGAALQAIALDPAHDGAYHVLGRWHAEIQRLSALQKFFARQFMGASIFEAASWDEAERNLRKSVALRPEWIYHRLGLAEILIDRQKWADAQVQLDAIAALPPIDPMDPTYKRQAQALAAKLPVKVKG